jgi:predicted DNA-binding transcriptional regulator YafY
MLPNPSPSQRRVQVLMALLRRGQARTADLARALSMDPKLVRNDLNHLLPVAPFRSVGEGRHRHWQVDDGFAVEGLGLLDRVSLQLGRGLTDFLGGTGLGDLARTVRPWDGVPPRFRRNIGKKLRLLHEPSREYASQRDTIDSLLDALLRERKVSFRYRSGDGLQEVTDACPLTLVVYRRALYLLARLESGVQRRFSVDQIQDVTSGPEFDYPLDFKPDDTLNPWFGIHAGDKVQQVHLRFSAKVARYVYRRRWHPTQELWPREDGGVDLVMQTGGQELVRF